MHENRASEIAKFRAFIRAIFYLENVPKQMLNDIVPKQNISRFLLKGCFYLNRVKHGVGGLNCTE